MEELAVALEDLRQGGNQQAFAKAPRARQKIDALGVAHQLVKIARLVDIQKATVDQIAESIGAGL